MADLFASAGVLVVGGDVADAGVQAGSVVVAAGASQLGVESGRVADLFEVGVLGFEVPEEGLSEILCIGCDLRVRGWELRTGKDHVCD